MNLEEENELSVEKNKDDYELLGITWGKFYQKSFVFHVKHNDRYFEFIRNHINSNEVWSLR